jgi:hypothetical protein
MSDPERLFEEPVSEIAIQLGECDVLIQLVPEGDEGSWLEAERLFAQALGVPTIRSESTPLSENDLATIRATLRRRGHALQPMARALRDGYDGDGCPFNMAVRPRDFCVLALLVATALALAVFLKSATVFAVLFVLVVALHRHMQERLWNAMMSRSEDPLSFWDDSLKRAFSRTRDFVKYKDFYDTGLGYDTGFPSNEMIRNVVKYGLCVLLLAVGLAFDIIRIAWTLLGHG